MKLLIERIKKDGIGREGGVIKVDSFINHQMDTALMNEIGKEFARRFEHKKVDKILTIEASGIGIAVATAFHMGMIPAVFAKKIDAKHDDRAILRRRSALLYQRNDQSCQGDQKLLARGRKYFDYRRLYGTWRSSAGADLHR